MPTLIEARLYLGIDVVDDDLVNANVERCLRAAVKTLYGAVGDDLEDYLPGDPRATELVLIYLEDLYSQRGIAAKVSGATRRLVFDMEQQLKMELRQAKEAAQI